tara:strand:+ start:607 stop:1218 length:612 start_codon:yes stop_codon:yes gene_type:complete
MSLLVYPTIKESPILSMLGMGGGGTGTALASSGPSFPAGSVQVTIRTSANSSWDGNYGVRLNDGSTETQITNSGSVAPTDNSLITPQSAALFNTCLQTSTGGIGVGRGSSWGRVDIYFASAINIKYYGSGNGNSGTGSWAEYADGQSFLYTSSSNLNGVVHVWAYHQSGAGGGGITQLCRQDGSALFYESGSIDTNRLMAYGS